METLGLVHTPGVGTTQVGDLNFKSMCKLKDGTILAAGTSNLVSLDTASNDNGTNIDAFLEFPRTDFGLSNKKRIRKVVLGFEADGNLTLRFKDDQGTWLARTVIPLESGQTSEGRVAQGGRTLKGRYFEFRIDNVSGSDFSIDAIDVMLTILAKRTNY